MTLAELRALIARFGPEHDAVDVVVVTWTANGDERQNDRVSVTLDERIPALFVEAD